MAVVQTAMLGGMPYTALRDTIFTHPTAAEGLLGLFANVPSAPALRQSFSGDGQNTRRRAPVVPVPAKE